MVRIGAVNYLNSKPLVCGLEALAPDVRLSFDLPSRLAYSLAAGRLDVALIPAVEFFRSPGYRVVSDACVACRGPVLSVKLHFRVPPNEVRRVALDEGSRTSSALTQILLAELHGARPQLKPLPIGCGLDASDADAVLLIGDRAIVSAQDVGNDDRLRIAATRHPAIPAAGCPGLRIPSHNPKSEIRNPKSNSDSGDEFVDVWDLGDVWCRWTGLPFVFAMWIARPDVQSVEVAPVLNAARDDGLRQLARIVAHEAKVLGISPELATRYLRDNLHFKLGRKERAGLRMFYQLCVKHGLAPGGLEPTLDSYTDYGCAAR
jgi:chorismate dehydratase